MKKFKLFLKGVIIGSGLIGGTLLTIAILDYVAPGMGLMERLNNNLWILSSACFLGVLWIRQKYHMPFAWVLIGAFTGGLIIPLMLGAAFTTQDESRKQ